MKFNKFYCKKIRELFGVDFTGKDVDEARYYRLKNTVDKSIADDNVYNGLSESEKADYDKSAKRLIRNMCIESGDE